MSDLDLIYPQKPKQQQKKPSKKGAMTVDKKQTTTAKRKHVSRQVSKQTSKQVNKFTNKQDYVKDFLAKKAFVTASFRLPPEIIDKFNEMYYLAKSRHKSDFKRYSIIVAALAVFLWDFENNGEKSEFYKLLIEEKKNVNK